MSRPVIHLPATAIGEEELVGGLRRGDVASYRHLYELFAPKLRRILGRTYRNAVADDAVQATFLVAYQKVAQFDGRASLLTWLTRIALRQAARAARKEGSETASQPPQPEALSGVHSPEEAAMQGQLAGRLAALIGQLPERKRVALLLFEVEGFSVQEIADILEEPRGTVLARLSRTRAELREALTGGAPGNLADSLTSRGQR